MEPYSFNILSLCTGAGGLDLGLRLAQRTARTVCYVEIEAHACEVLVTRMEEACLDDAPLWTDLGTFDGRPWRGLVDCLIGGYPCQPFSIAGQRKGADDPRHLWPHFARIIGECEPEWVFLENVANHLNVGYRQVREELEELGYRVTEGLFTAAEVGAPHLRQRLFVLAHAERLGRRQPAGDFDQERKSLCAPVWQEGTFRAGSGSQDVANANSQLHNGCQQCGPRGRTEHPDGSKSLGGAHVGDPKGLRRDKAECGKAQGVRSDASVKTMADTGGKGRQGRQQLPSLSENRDRSETHGSAGELCRPFPPGPDDLEGWQKYLQHNPGLEPAVCRSPDGLARRLDGRPDPLEHRADRLHLTGNGVVPLVAAHAWRILKSRFDQDNA